MMKVMQMETAGLAQYGYVVSCGGEAIVIDPMRDYERYVRYAAEQGLRIRYVTETHIHADYASGAAALAAASGAELALSGHDEGELYRYAMEHRRLRDGDELRVGRLRLRALWTPGHTPEHVSFVLYDEVRSLTEPVALFSGDFLFIGSLGRPDLLGEGETERLVRELYRSVQERIAGLPDGVMVYPGHGAGSLCGSGMSASSSSTLGYERATQALFGLEEGRFVEQVLGSVPAMPSYYPRMKALNAAGARDVAALPAMRRMGARELESRRRAGEVTVVDLRRPEAFGGAHVPGAISLGAGDSLAMWAGWLLDPEAAVVLVGESGREADEARLALLRVGLDGIEGQLEGGMTAWMNAGLPLARVTQVVADEVRRRLDGGAVVVDVRMEQEWVGGHIAGARHLMLGELSGGALELERDVPVITVCGSGYRSSVAASLLQRLGFTAVASMAGGMAGWGPR